MVDDMASCSVISFQICHNVFGNEKTQIGNIYVNVAAAKICSGAIAVMHQFLLAMLCCLNLSELLRSGVGC